MIFGFFHKHINIHKSGIRSLKGHYYETLHIFLYAHLCSFVAFLNSRLGVFKKLRQTQQPC